MLSDENVMSPEPVALHSQPMAHDPFLEKSPGVEAAVAVLWEMFLCGGDGCCEAPAVLDGETRVQVTRRPLAPRHEPPAQI